MTPNRSNLRHIIVASVLLLTAACGGAGTDAADTGTGGADVATDGDGAGAATLESLQVTPPTASIASGTTQNFTATGSYADGTTEDLTAQVTAATCPTTSSSNRRASEPAL